jgi:hypothetical protein
VALLRNTIFLEIKRFLTNFAVFFLRKCGFLTAGIFEKRDQSQRYIHSHENETTNKERSDGIKGSFALDFLLSPMRAVSSESIIEKLFFCSSD